MAKNKSDNDSYIKVNVYLNGNCIAPTVAEWSKTPHGKRYLKGERLPLDKKFKKGTVGWVRQQFIGKYDKAIDLVNAPVPKPPYIAHATLRTSLSKTSTTVCWDVEVVRHGGVAAQEVCGIPTTLLGLIVVTHLNCVRTWE